MMALTFRDAHAWLAMQRIQYSSLTKFRPRGAQGPVAPHRSSLRNGAGVQPTNPSPTRVSEGAMEPRTAGKKPGLSVH